MRRPSRIRRIAKWTGLVLCVVVVVAWGVSTWRGVFWERSDGRFLCTYGLRGGVAGWTRVPASYPSFMQQIGRIPEPLGLRWFHGVDRFGLCLPYWRGDRPWRTYVWIPLWIPFVLLAVPTTLLWYRDRRPPRGHCQRCGYNLVGNLSGTCPECGQACVLKISGEHIRG
jgi:hypothetical protein